MNSKTIAVNIAAVPPQCIRIRGRWTDVTPSEYLTRLSSRRCCLRHGRAAIAALDYWESTDAHNGAGRVGIFRVIGHGPDATVCLWLFQHVGEDVGDFLRRVECGCRFRHLAPPLFREGSVDGRGDAAPSPLFLEDAAAICRYFHLA